MRFKTGEHQIQDNARKCTGMPQTSAYFSFSQMRAISKILVVSLIWPLVEHNKLKHKILIRVCNLDFNKTAGIKPSLKERIAVGVSRKTNLVLFLTIFYSELVGYFNPYSFHAG